MIRQMRRPASLPPSTVDFASTGIDEQTLEQQRQICFRALRDLMHCPPHKQAFVLALILSEIIDTSEAPLALLPYLVAGKADRYDD